MKAVTKYKPKTLLRLKKKNAPGCEFLTDKDFDEWMTEEVLRFQRTKIISSELVSGLARGLRSVVAFACKKHSLTCIFDDILHDAILAFLEKYLPVYDPIRSRITYYLSKYGYFVAMDVLEFSHSENMREEDYYIEMSPLPEETFVLEDFLLISIPDIQWRMSSTICTWIALLIVMGIEKKKVLLMMDDTILHRCPHKQDVLYDYTLVTLRITLAKQLERNSGGMFPDQSDRGVLSDLREGQYAEAD
jgi:hypothetical protein